MSDQPVSPPQPQPQTIVQAGGRVAESLVAGFTGAPTLLLIVILNICMIIVSGYYLLRQDELRAEVNKDLVTLIRACILQTTPVETYREEGRIP